MTVPPEEPGRLARLLVRALLLGFGAAVAGRLTSGSAAAAGAFAGCLAAGVYAWGYLRSHLARAGRSEIFDRGLVRHSVLRIAALGVAGAAMLAMGKMALIGYLTGFMVAFAVLVGLEAPAVARRLRANGLVG